MNIFGVQRPEKTISDEYYSVSDLCNKFLLTDRTIRRWHESNFGPPRQLVNKQICYKKSDVEEWLRKREQLARSVYTVPELAELLQVSERTLRRWEKTGQGPERYIERNRIFYTHQAVEYWLQYSEGTKE